MKFNPSYVVVILSFLVFTSFSFKMKKKEGLFLSYCNGVLKEIDIKPDHKLECIEPEWRLDKSNDYIQMGTELNNCLKQFEIIGKNLNKSMDVSCSSKKEVIQYFKEKFQMDKKNKKLFLELEDDGVNDGGESKKKEKGKGKGKKGKGKKGKQGKQGKQGKKGKKGKTQRFGAFHIWYPHLNSFKEAFERLHKSTMYKKTVTFLDCMMHGKDTKTGGIKIYYF